MQQNQLHLMEIVFLDPFLSRIVELALTPSERQTKVAACELIHPLVLYMVERRVFPIYFYPFLPRIVGLALTSSERQTKVSACELLYSVVLYMVGRGATQLNLFFSLVYFFT